jgi:hypothetical protein
MMLRRGVPLAIATGLVLATAGFGAAVAPAAGPYVCSGTLGSAGKLHGTYPNGVVVKGACAVKTGTAHVIGTLTVTKGSALGAAYGGHHSSLTVTGNLVVDKGAVAILGCKVNPDGSGFPCIDETSMKHPTLKGHETVTGNLIENSPLGVVMHNSTIGGSIKETGGGGGLSCAPPKSGVFALFMSPVYSDYEDSTIGGNVAITGLKSCYLAVIRDNVHGNLGFTNNTLGDPDAIEIEADHVGKNLACHGNSSVWDSHELSMTANFPRGPDPNTVHGTRSGQCVLSTPTTMGGSSGPGAF